MVSSPIPFLCFSYIVVYRMGKLNPDKKKGVSQKAFHANLATVFWLLAFAG